MQSSAAMQQSCILMAKEIVSCFPMNKAEEEEVEEEVNKEEEVVFVGLGNCFFPVNKEWEKKKEEKEEEV